MITNAQERSAFQGVNSSDPLVHLAAIMLLSKSEVHCDCEGSIIKPGDMVEVEREDEMREGKSHYQFCSKGKKGKILRHIPGCNSWIVEVEFLNDNGKPQSTGCVDYHLRKIETTLN